MSKVKLGIAVALLGVAMTVSAVAVAGGGGGKTKAKLSGFQEVPAIVTDGEGKFKAKINKSARTIDYTLSYSGLEGGNVRFAHIHIGQRTANGDVVVFLCGGGGKPACPGPSGGSVSGTITPADIQPPDATPQGVTAPTPEEFDDLVRAIRAGVTYANVHTDVYGGGEIRGQIRGGGDD
jgi:CHRD domain